MKRLLFALLLSTQALAATTIDLLVAEKDTPAFAAATAKADEKTVFAFSKLNKALSKVEELISAAPKCPQPKVRGMKAPPCELPENDRFWVINVKVAHGALAGKGGTGNFSLGELIAPDTTLRLLGGYDDAFEKRAPFDTPTVVSLGGTAFVLGGKDHALKEFYLSGFVMDVGGGNKYDAKTNSLLKGESAGVQHITIGYLTTQRLVLADNVFLNSSHKAAAPLIRAASPSAEVIVRNNFVLNNVLAWEADSARFKDIPAQYVIEGNSFIMNWPYNPDPTTGNPAALQLGQKYATQKFVITGNLFAHNVGGAIYSTATSEKTGPSTEIKGNLFFNNGGLFGEAAPGAAAMVAKFGGFKSQEVPWNVISLASLEEDYEWKSSGNVALDPKVPIVLVKPGFANSNAVSAENTALNDVRGLLGQNKQGGAVKIKDFAPRMGLDPAKLPFPEEPKAQAYGVSRARTEQF